jgi:nitroimidazol reductase NimA-like FMN-containing flavoprotein (pyridoxamine 5'-phosphate oxidase superfamily)
MKTARTSMQRLPKRGAYDRATIDAILDEALTCHLALVRDGHPLAIPTLHARVGDYVYVHGSAASRTLRALTAGVEVCLTVTLVDGLVLARSAFHHSVNYRSVMLFGTAEPVQGADRKRQALAAFTEKLVPGRWPDVRPPSEKELKATTVLRLGLTEASAKVRGGPPLDEDEDHELDVWAGVIPLTVRRLAPVPDPLLRSGIPLPDYVQTD